MPGNKTYVTSAMLVSVPLVSEDAVPIEYAKRHKYHWPYSNINAHLDLLTREAKKIGIKIISVKVEYLGTIKEEGRECHHSRCTAETVRE